MAGTPQHFDVEALGRNGETYSWTLSGPGAEEIVSELQSRGYYPLQIIPARGAAAAVPVEELPPAPKHALTEILNRAGSLRDAVLAGDDSAWHEYYGMLRDKKTLENKLLGARPGSPAELEAKAVGMVVEGLVSDIESCTTAQEYRKLVREREARHKQAAARVQKGDFQVLREMSTTRFGAGFLHTGGQEVAGSLHAANLNEMAVFWVPEDAAVPPLPLAKISEVKSAKAAGWFRKRFVIRTASGQQHSIRTRDMEDLRTMDRFTRICAYELRNR